MKWCLRRVAAVTAIALFANGKPVFAEDGSLTSSKLRETLSQMKFVGDESEAECRSGRLSEALCATLESVRTSCLSLKKSILDSSDDVVIKPKIESDHYDQILFDGVLGKCKGKALNVISVGLRKEKKFVSNSTLIVYDGVFFGDAGSSTVVFGRHFDELIEYRGREENKRRYHSFYSYFNENICMAEGFYSVPETSLDNNSGSGVGGEVKNSHQVYFDFTSIIKINKKFYIANYYREYGRVKDVSDFLDLVPMEKIPTTIPCGFVK